MIYHLAIPGEWATAKEAGEYTTSTRGVTLADEGFIHPSGDLDQVRRVYELIYADLGELLLLVIDENRLDAPVRMESPPGSEELFPHIYGPVPIGAVIEVLPYP